MRPDFAVVVDGGASRTRCAILDRSGRQLSYHESGGSNFYGSNSDQTSQALTAAITGALADAGTTAAEAACVAAGMASVGPDGEGAAEIDRVLEGLGFARRLVVGDLLIAHVGALNYGPGVLVIAGTGSSCIAFTADGRRMKIGGWGPTIGDEGSGYHIGRSSLNAAAKAYDGYGPQTLLVDTISQALKISEFHQCMDYVYGSQSSIGQIARLAEATQRAAAAGDPVATAILTSAAEDLAAMAITVLLTLFPKEPEPKVSFAGSLIGSCETVREHFTRTIQTIVPNAKVILPQYPPLIGAFLIACSELGWSRVVNGDPS